MSRVTTMMAVLIALIASAFLATSVALAAQGSPPPASGNWSVGDGDTSNVIVHKSTEAATYKITNNGESDTKVWVVRTDKDGGEINGSGVELDPGDSVDFGCGADEGILVKRRGNQGQDASGTFVRY